MSLTLYVEPRWISPYVFSCWVALTEKGLPFQVHALDSARNETKATDYVASTVTGRIPSLVHDGFAIAESSAIVEYLEEAFPAVPVLPRSLRDRARCRQVMSWLRSDETLPIRSERPTTTMFYERADRPLSSEATTAAAKLCEVAARLVSAAEGHVFDTWSIVDAELAFMLHRLLANDDSVPSGVRAWAEGQWSRPSVQKFVQIQRPKTP